MQYFKHSELADTYHVSLKTVHNWIDAAKQGKMTLQLHHVASRTYVANTPGNMVTLKQLSTKGRKYRNTLHHKVIHPQSAFYDIYNRRQILDIVNNLNVHKEIPRQYNYLGEGATNWDIWTRKLETEESSNILKGTMELLRANMVAIDKLLEDGKRVNVIDLGAGNAYPVKELLDHLRKRRVLNRYIAIDISEPMLAIAKQNVEKWYDGEVKFEGYVKDITHERFDDVLVDDVLADGENEIINLVLLLGGTPNNLRTFGDVLKPIYGSIGGRDALVYTVKPDTEAARNYFDFSAEPGVSTLSPSHRYILELLNIDESLYDAEMGFDPIKKMRYIRARLKSSLTIMFNNGIERIVNLEKGDAILLLRVRHMTVRETLIEFEKAGFTLLQSSLTKDRQFFLSISGIEAKSE